MTHVASADAQVTERADLFLVDVIFHALNADLAGQDLGHGVLEDESSAHGIAGLVAPAGEIGLLTTGDLATWRLASGIGCWVSSYMIASRSCELRIIVSHLVCRYLKDKVSKSFDT